MGNPTLAYFPALRSSFGVANQINSPLGGTSLRNSMSATPAFFSDEI